MELAFEAFAPAMDVHILPDTPSCARKRSVERSARGGGNKFAETVNGGREKEIVSLRHTRDPHIGRIFWACLQF